MTCLAGIWVSGTIKMYSLAETAGYFAADKSVVHMLYKCYWRS